MLFTVAINYFHNRSAGILSDLKIFSETKEADQTKVANKVLNAYSESPKKLDPYYNQQQKSPQQQQHHQSPQNVMTSSTPQQITWQQQKQLQQQQQHSTLDAQLWQQRKQLGCKPTDLSSPGSLVNASDDKCCVSNSSFLHSTPTQANNAQLENAEYHHKNTKGNTTEKKVVFNLQNTSFQLEDELLDYLHKSEQQQTRHKHQQQNQLLNQHNNFHQQNFQQNSPQQNQSKPLINQQHQQATSLEHNSSCASERCQKGAKDCGADKIEKGAENDRSDNGISSSSSSSRYDQSGSKDVLVNYADGGECEKKIAKGCLGCSCEPDSEVSLLEKSKIREVSV